MRENGGNGTTSEVRYDFGGIDLDSGSVHADVVELVGRDARVLELGPATGYMSRVLSDRGCTVVGIELDPIMAERAEEFCQRIIVGDLDRLDLDAELGEERFDVVVAADVLEHLKDPLGLLRRLHEFLKPGGGFVISVPNVAHGSVRLALLTGHFDYSKSGLLDMSHLRFFTRESLAELLDEAELGVLELHRHELNFDASEVEFDPAAVPPELRTKLESDPDARTYQYVAKAIPMQEEGMRELQSRLRDAGELRQVHTAELETKMAEIAEREAELRQVVSHAAELETKMAEMAEREAELREVVSHTAELETKMAEIAEREGELRRALIDAHDQLLRRDEELVELQDVAHRRHLEIERLQDVNQHLQSHLDAIQASRPMRAYGILRNLPVLRSLARRRQAAP